MDKKPGFMDAISATLGGVTSAGLAFGKVMGTVDVVAGIGLQKAQNMAQIIDYEDKLTMLELKAESVERANALKQKGLDVDSIEI